MRHSASARGANTSPFVSPEVFRLIVRLEAQKALGAVDVDTLERKFRVPHGFANEDIDHRRHEAADADPRARVAPASALVGAPALSARRHWAPSAEADAVSMPPKDSATPSSRSPFHSPSFSSTTRHTQSAVFPRVSRDVLLRPQTNPGLGPGAYELPPPSASSCSAVFGACREKRVVMWSPARVLPSNATPEAWNVSPQYATAKAKVLHAAEQQRRKMKRKQLVHVHTRDASSSGRDYHAGHSKHPDSSEPPPLDPFEWLRQQPHGEQRAALLAAKFSLADHHVKLHMSPQGLPHLSDHTLLERSAHAAADHELSEGHTSRGHETHECVRPELKWTSLSCSSTRDVRRANDAMLQCTDDARDERIVVSCRLPGGLMLTLTLFSRKKVRHLKALILQKQTQFAHDSQFDLYLPNGTRLGQLEDSLHASGIGNRSLVQIVPTAPR